MYKRRNFNVFDPCTCQTTDNANLEEILTEIKQLQSTIGKELVMQALQKTYGNRNEAAKRLQ
ncbi:helix-turn-helix domain-containing protein, partial [Peribacillus frigoritolerans]|uniref:helix-turn-helix domain-containing protein n=1 Tax=Peribacillus frigoritolerans TaxID=450367 RepID=UPI0025B68EDD